MEPLDNCLFGLSEISHLLSRLASDLSHIQNNQEPLTQRGIIHGDP